MSLVVDRVSAGPVGTPEAVFDGVRPLHRRRSSASTWRARPASKVQDYAHVPSCRSPRILRPGHHGRSTALCNQSLSFHSNRFGGTLVSQTTEVHEPATQLLLEHHHLPVSAGSSARWRSRALILASARCRRTRRCSWRMLAVYAGVSATYMYKRILHLNEQAGQCAEPAVGRAVGRGRQHPGGEDLRARGLRAACCSTQANREVVARDSKRMRASLARGITTACYHGGHHVRGDGVHLRRQRLVRHHAGHGHPHVHLHEHGDEPVQLHQYRPAAHQPGLRRCKRHDGGARRAAAGGR